MLDFVVSQSASISLKQLILWNAKKKRNRKWYKKQQCGFLLLSDCHRCFSFIWNIRRWHIFKSIQSRIGSQLTCFYFTPLRSFELSRVNLPNRTQIPWNMMSRRFICLPFNSLPFLETFGLFTRRMPKTNPPFIWCTRLHVTEHVNVLLLHLRKVKEKMIFSPRAALFPACRSSRPEQKTAVNDFVKRDVGIFPIDISNPPLFPFLYLDTPLESVARVKGQDGLRYHYGCMLPCGQTDRQTGRKGWRPKSPSGAEQVSSCW